jgi:hypothetical protein
MFLASFVLLVASFAYTYTQKIPRNVGELLPD